MLLEFGADAYGDPRVAVGWNSKMALVCGVIGRVIERRQSTDGISLTVRPKNTSAHVWYGADEENISVRSIFMDFNWSAQMFEPIPVVVVAVEDPSVSALLQLLGPPPAGALTTHPR